MYPIIVMYLFYRNQLNNPQWTIMKKYLGYKYVVSTTDEKSIDVSISYWQLNG